MRVTLELTTEMVEAAYRHGIFPMAVDHRNIFTWHLPEPRAILPLDSFHCSRSLAKLLRQLRFEITFDRAFREVMEGCADRPEGTWINRRLIEVYCELFASGKAHSVEVWTGETLAGGTYGVHLGGAFMAESKFHRVRDASKVALAVLVERLRAQRFELLDVQYLTPHLARFGVIEIPSEEYDRRLKRALRLVRTFP
ncbi:MAG: leucyl/phenylalanyl-tRNA--protein transferase [Candidatus Riflebacteria bacterium]|nr:leucyl/phenylalanyl-tRNA--protein transferase [Candidatus Riflebacteria bacterium]